MRAVQPHFCPQSLFLEEGFWPSRPCAFNTRPSGEIHGLASKGLILHQNDQQSCSRKGAVGFGASETGDAESELRESSEKRDGKHKDNRACDAGLSTIPSIGWGCSCRQQEEPQDLPSGSWMRRRPTEYSPSQRLSKLAMKSLFDYSRPTVWL